MSTREIEKRVTDLKKTLLQYSQKLHNAQSHPQEDTSQKQQSESVIIEKYKFPITIKCPEDFAIYRDFLEDAYEDYLESLNI